MTGVSQQASRQHRRSLVTGWGLGLVLAILWATISGTGCQAVKTAADLPGDAVRVVAPDKPKRVGPDPADLQQELMRFADEYVARILSAIDELQATDPRVTMGEVQRMRVGYASDVWMAAAGSNPYANLMDLMAVTALSRIIIEEHWIPNVFGESANGMLEAVKQGERDIWAIAGTFMTDEQLAELRAAVQEWRRENPDAVHAISVRAVGAAASVRDADSEDAQRPNSVFRFLMLDPLAGLDPATRELAQARLAADRALFVAQRLPFLVRWQAEVFSSRALELPEVRQVLTNSTRIAEAATSVSRAAEQFPDRFTLEREEILAALSREQTNVYQLATEVRGALAAGSLMASNTALALSTFDDVVEKLEGDGSNPSAEPFRISDYRKTAEQLDATAVRLTGLLQEFDRVLGSSNLVALVEQAGPVLQEAESSGRALIDYAFLRALLFLGAACGLVLITALGYRRLVKRS